MKKTRLDKYVEYLSGYADAETAEEIREQLEDPGSEASRFFAGMRASLRDPFGLGRPLFAPGEVCEEFSEPVNRQQIGDDERASVNRANTLPTIAAERSTRYRPWVFPSVAAAIAASLLIGVLIGKLALLGGGRISPDGDLEILLASATPKLGVARGDSRPLVVEVAGERPGFATVIALAPDRRQRVFPEPGDDPILVEPSKPEVYGPIPPESAILLVLVTERPATESIRDALLGKDFRAGDLYRLRDALRVLLSESGHRWVGLGVAPVAPLKENVQ